MAADTFAVTRSTGLSNTQVLCEFVGERAPGTLFSYQELQAVLSEGASREFTARDVQGVVTRAGRMLGKLHKRALQNVKGRGYRLAHATDHMGLAISKKTEAMRKMKRGMQLLMDVRLDEIKDPEARKAHEGQALILSGQLSVLGAHERRLARIERLIDESIIQK